MFEYLRHQGFIDRCRSEVVSLLHETISCLFHGEQFLGNARRIALKSVGYLATIGSRVYGEDLLGGAYEVAIGMAHPELSHVPGIVGEFTHDVRLGQLGLAIEVVYVLYEEGDLNTAAALSRREEARALGRPVWCAICRQLDRGLPTRQFSIFVCIAGDDTKAQDILKPCD